MIMETGTRLCDECRAKPAKIFCTCTDKEIFLCAECQLAHFNKRTRDGHSAWPVYQLLTYKDPDYFDRQEAFPRLQAQAEEAVTAVDKAIAEYQAHVDKVIREINTASNATVTKLQEIKAQLRIDVSISLEEVEKTLADLKPRFRSKYGSVFRDQTERPKPFQLFVYASPVNSVSVQSLITPNYGLRLPSELLKEMREEPRLAPAVRKISQPPPTFFDANKETAEQVKGHYLESIQIYEAQFPNLLEFAVCRYNFGAFYKDSGNFEKAKSQYLQAISLFEARFPNTIDFAKCLKALGSLYRDMKKYTESQSTFLKSLPIYSAHFPKTLEYAECLASFGWLYHCQKRHNQEERSLAESRRLFEQAEIYMQQANDIYQAHFPEHIGFAHNLQTLSSLYEANGMKVKAQKKLRAAQQLFDKNGDQTNVEKCKAALQRLAK